MLNILLSNKYVNKLQSYHYTCQWLSVLNKQLDNYYSLKMNCYCVGKYFSL